ncbi:hypothetical protein E2C01_056970 [Portunus trituberculatus]|uniref:Uncharacterized protein n=1 Tax=Portunus trituberculatus TaxID=210409 RepID=A0A5B7GS93_PORTR|nr:hypothetical protein [Portunus trituberculatus]
MTSAERQPRGAAGYSGCVIVCEGVGVYCVWVCVVCGCVVWVCELCASCVWLSVAVVPLGEDTSAAHQESDGRGASLMSRSHRHHAAPSRSPALPASLLPRGLEAGGATLRHVGSRWRPLGLSQQDGPWPRGPTRGPGPRPETRVAAANSCWRRRGTRRCPAPSGS